VKEGSPRRGGNRSQTSRDFMKRREKAQGLRPARQRKEHRLGYGAGKKKNSRFRKEGKKKRRSSRCRGSALGICAKKKPGGHRARRRRDGNTARPDAPAGGKHKGPSEPGTGEGGDHQKERSFPPGTVKKKRGFDKEWTAKGTQSGERIVARRWGVENGLRDKRRVGFH